MAFTDPFIARPVLATVVSLLIILLGFQVFRKLTIRQYPQMENALITVTTAYPGPNAETIQGYITQPMQQGLATGAGAVSRFDIGLVIATGMSVGTLFTLFVLPCVYSLLAQPDAPPTTAKSH